MSGKELSAAALKLPANSRAKLAAKLLESLNGASDPEINAAWADEAEARIDAFDAGKISAKPVASVLRNLNRRARR
jgi:putative addiction module component (TIGR02574 family)